MQIDILTIFPEMFEGPLTESILKRAQEKGLVKIKVHDLRDWAEGKHKQVDDKPFGGGGGMVMMVEPIHKALKELREKNAKTKPYVIVTTAKGPTYVQSTAKRLAKVEHIIIVCGHYEGIDQRVLDNLVDEQISIGNYVLTGGEIPAMVIIDSITRLVPGVVGNEQTPQNDSFYQDDKTIQYPIYTRPAEYDLDGKKLKVPDVLISGDHKEIENWRRDNSK